MVHNRISNTTNGFFVQESSEDRLQRLESDKQSLMLQVSVLTEQVEAQGEKIRELEYNSEEKRARIMNTEALLQKVGVGVCPILFKLLQKTHPGSFLS
ncbi:hypothetical protein ACJMK2_020942 [Sinanodonta woodiana]|uniref:Liprin-beta-1/2 coiled-coil domain-containing protein n=1 Tax=Sinanodonta woodiana TaxID=1069815 RepID=A0ABD3U0Q1_SINWO